ncbi:MAG: hypothetical protein ACXADY_17845 [Candidatus Hodarchaeales archaeon]|jgi:hypothetical protein
MSPNNNFNEKNAPKFDEKVSEDEENLSELAKKVTQIKKHLNIPDEVTNGIKAQFEESYNEAKKNISKVGGSDADLAKMWGYHFGALLYAYLERRDTLEGRQALSFIKMQLGYELNVHIGGSEMLFASFVLGLSMRFMRGFETLKKNLNKLEKAIKMLEQQPDEKKEKPSIFSSKR